MSDKLPEKKTGLDLMREPFLPNQISKLPKPTKKQTEDIKADFKKGVHCEICGAWHHPDVVHLDYVGHAALTDRLLDCDPKWSWEPLACGPDGYPVIDKDGGGMWIKLTVCGMTRLGYGDAQGKSGGDAMKERIGDALRNAAMRFGAALDLWHKGDLHVGEEPEQKEEKKDAKKEEKKDVEMPTVNKTLHDELAAYCTGDTKIMDDTLKRLSYYKTGEGDEAKEYSFGLDRLPKTSEKWAGKVLTALRKAISDETKQDVPAICSECHKPFGVDGRCECPF